MSDEECVREPAPDARCVAERSPRGWAMYAVTFGGRKVVGLNPEAAWTYAAEAVRLVGTMELGKEMA